jgi:hypothetical protein
MIRGEIRQLIRRMLAVTIPAGASITITNGPRPDDKRFVDVLWRSRALVLFAEDVRTRGEKVDALTDTVGTESVGLSRSLSE